MTYNFLSRLQESLFSNNRKSLPRKRSGSYRRTLSMESLESRELLSITTLDNLSVSANTGEKPQSKVFEYAGQWWTVMPNSSGTSVFRLDGTSWTPTQQISTAKGIHADVKLVGDLAHVLLFDKSSSQLATLQYDAVDNRFEPWSLQPQLVSIPISGSAETATLEVDSTGRMWVAYDVSTTVEVRYSDGLYTGWSAPITVASGMSSDDISTIIAMPNNSIGVLWSNQKTDVFNFRVHQDGAAPTAWSANEVAASQWATTVGGAMSDDHVNVAVASDGTLYAAVKTGYDSSSRPEIALLVRRPNGTWDNLYQVDTRGTRPIVVVNEAANKLIVAYTQSDGGGDIYYRESPLGNISFGPRQVLIGGSNNNVTSTKHTSTNEIVFLAGTSSTARGVLYTFDTATPPPINQPPTSNAGQDQSVLFGDAAVLDGTFSDDGRPSGTLATTWSKASGPGTVTFGNSAAVDTSASFSEVGEYVLRLTVSDGLLTTADEMRVTVSSPGPNVVNQVPTLSAGRDRWITSGNRATLNGWIADDGLPSGNLTSLWTKVSGPGAVTILNDQAPRTFADFSQPGDYVLRLTADDGELTASDEINVHIAAPTANEAPTLSAGRDRWIVLGNRATLNGWIADDGLPTGALSSLWTKVSGPGTVTIVNASAPRTHASFSQAGDYVLRLTASDGQLTSADEINVSVSAPAANEAPSLSAGRDRSISSGNRATLNGWAADDGMPNGTLLTSWTKVSGPGEVTFVDSSAARTFADFSEAGLYRLRLTASDGELSSFDEMTVDIAGAGGGSSESTSEPQEIAFQDGLFPFVSYAGTSDTKIASNHAATNFGTSLSIDVDGGPDVAGLLRWDVSAIPATNIVVSAAIELNVTNTSSHEYEAFALERAWDELSATWEQFATGKTWAGAGAEGGGDHDDVVLGRLAATSQGIQRIELNEAGVAAVQAWIITPSSNHGIILKDYLASDGVDFSTREASTASLRPKLIINHLSAPALVPFNSSSGLAVAAGPDRTTSVGQPLLLSGGVTDSGQPADLTLLTIQWSQISGPGTATFGDATSAITTAEFNATGEYVLRLTAIDGGLVEFDELTVSVS